MNPVKISNQRQVSFWAMGVVLLICIIYAGFKMTALIKGPAIEILSPTAGNIYASELVVVKGKVERITKIYMNDRQIFTDNEGHFSEPLLLFSGYNILTLKATDAFGRKVSKQIELIYQG